MLCADATARTCKFLYGTNFVSRKNLNYNKQSTSNQEKGITTTKQYELWHHTEIMFNELIKNI